MAGWLGACARWWAGVSLAVIEPMRIIMGPRQQTDNLKMARDCDRIADKLERAGIDPDRVYALRALATRHRTRHQRGGCP